MIFYIIGGVVLLVILLILAGIGIFVAATYNRFVKLRNSVKNSFAQIDAQLQRRFDLIPNLVETVKGYASHEKNLLSNVEASREGYLHAGSNAEKIAMDNRLTSTLKSLFVVSKNYPDLKANATFLNLQEELSETEDKIAFARQFYNDAVTIYNNKLQMFPGNLVAGMFGFREEELFNAVDDADDAPDVDFAVRPAKCPHCMGVIGNEKICPYCGTRVVE